MPTQGGRFRPQLPDLQPLSVVVLLCNRERLGAQAQVDRLALGCCSVVTGPDRTKEEMPCVASVVFQDRQHGPQLRVRVAGSSEAGGGKMVGVW